MHSGIRKQFFKTFYSSVTNIQKSPYSISIQLDKLSKTKHTHATNTQIKKHYRNLRPSLYSPPVITIPHKDSHCPDS